MSVFKSGAKLSGGIIMAAILGFFLCVSINVICTALFTDYIGYNAYVYTEDSDKAIAEYQYLYTDTDGDGKDNGTDTKKAEYEEQGYTVTTYKVRSTLEGAGKLVFLSITQVLNLVLLIAFASSSNCYCGHTLHQTTITNTYAYSPGRLVQNSYILLVHRL